MFRFRDIVLSVFGLLFLSPVLVLITLSLALSQQHVFFRQQRPGRFKKPFVLIKFSTLRDILPGEKEEDNQQYRLTPVGRWLRRFSLDEIPQLINVLKGEMSLVGPRPLLMEYLPLYSTEDLGRFEVLPGITGWAQVNGRNNLSFKQRFALDLWYVRNKTFFLDLKILWLTLGQAILGTGVYADDKTSSEKFNGRN